MFLGYHAEHLGYRWIYDHIIKEHLTWLTGPNAIHFPKLGRHLAIFRPNVVPNIYQLVTAPLTAAIELKWQHLMTNPDRDPRCTAKMIDVQIVCLLERLVLYAMTGDRRVVPTRLAKVLGLTPTMFKGYLPSFSNVMSLVGPNAPSIEYADWPVIDGKPLIISGPTVLHHYNPKIAEVSTFSSHRRERHLSRFAATSVCPAERLRTLHRGLAAKLAQSFSR